MATTAAASLLKGDVARDDSFDESLLEGDKSAERPDVRLLLLSPTLEERFIPMVREGWLLLPEMRSSMSQAVSRKPRV